MTEVEPRRELPGVARAVPFFYGWLILAVTMIASFVGSGLNNVNMGVVFKPMSDELGWSRSAVAGAMAGGTLLGGVLAPVAGGLADRLGPRILIPVGAGLMALATLAIPFAREPWHFYAAYMPGRAISQMTVIGIVPLTAVANWFHVMRPRALGLVTMAVPLGAAVLAIGYQLLMNAYDWRAPFYVLAALLVCVVMVPSAVLLRRQPEDLGLLPDGRASSTRSSAEGQHGRHATASIDDNWTLREAMKTSTLWIIAVSLGLGTLGSGGMAFNLAAFFTDANFDPTLAAGTLSVFAFTGAVGSGLWGYAAERFSIRWLSAATYAISGLSLGLLLVEPTPLLAYAFAAIFGLTARGESAIGPILVAHFYGRRSFGAINGMISPFNMAGLGLGPVVAAATFDLTGSYHGIILAFILAFGISAVLMLITPHPTRSRPLVPRAETSEGQARL